MGMKKRYRRTKKRYQIGHRSVIIACSENLKTKRSRLTFFFIPLKNSYTLNFKVYQFRFHSSDHRYDQDRSRSISDREHISRSSASRRNNIAKGNKRSPYTRSYTRLERTRSFIIEFFMNSWFDLNRSQVPWTDSCWPRLIWMRVSLSVKYAKANASPLGESIQLGEHSLRHGGRVYKS